MLNKQKIKKNLVDFLVFLFIIGFLAIIISGNKEMINYLNFIVLLSILILSLPKGKKILKVKKLREDSLLPVRKHEGDAGLDLYSAEEVVLKPGELKIVSTGVAVEIPHGYFGLIKDRSGLAKRGLHVLAGVVDENYRGEVKVVLINLGKEEVKIEKNSRIAQLIVIPCEYVKVKEVKELSKTERGEKGFGSTGLK